MDLNSPWQGHHRSPRQFDGNSDLSLIDADDALAETGVARVRITPWMRRLVWETKH